MIKIQMVDIPAITADFTYNQFKVLVNSMKNWNCSKDFRIVGIIKGEQNEKN